MKTYIYAINGDRKTQIDLPIHFSEPVREDLIKRAVLALQSRKRQRYGADPKAGTRQGAATPKRRKKYKTTYGRGLSRIKRKYMWHRGGQFGWVGAFVANAVSGRKAFPPKAEKIFAEKINNKERRKAIRSAIAATAEKGIIVEDSIEALKKTKDVKKTLVKLKLKEDLMRTEKKKVRAGRGKTRGRKYRRKVGPLIVVGKDCELVIAGRNIAGIDICNIHSLNAENLAPGCLPGRRTIWTEGAIKKLKEGLFL